MGFQDLNWARWSQDGNLYFATVTAVSGNTLSIQYYDGSEDEVDRSDFFNLIEAMNSGMKPLGNWQGQGTFYPIELGPIGEDGVMVRYEDGTEEVLPYEWLVFWQTNTISGGGGNVIRQG